MLQVFTISKQKQQLTQEKKKRQIPKKPLKRVILTTFSPKQIITNEHFKETNRR